MKSLRKIKFLVLDVDGTMTDGGVYITERGEQMKKFNARDGMGIKVAIKAGFEVGIISHSMISEMVDTRAQMLGMKYVYIGQKPKIEILEDWIHQMEISLEEVAFIGDDINDLELIEKVGFSASPADGVKVVKEKVDLILNMKGGEGCVREFIDEYLLKNH